MPAAHLGVSQAEGRRLLGLSGSVPVLAFFGALAGARSLNEFAVETYGDVGPTVLHVSGERDFEGRARGCTRPDYLLVASTNEFGAALAAPVLAISRAGGTVWELAAAGTPRSSSRIHTPQPTTSRRTLAISSVAAVPSSWPKPTSRACPRWSMSCSPTVHGSQSMRAAMLSMARPQAADEIAEELIELAASAR